MTTKPTSGPIVLVTRSRDSESRLRTPLERATDRTVHSIPVTELALDDTDPDRLQRATDQDATTNGDENATHRIEIQPTATLEGGDPKQLFVFNGNSPPVDRSPAAIILELTTPERLRTLLRAVETATTSVPTVVAPPTGSETLATVALRTNADEYIPATSDEAVDRILETVSTATETGEDEAGELDRGYHRILADELPDEAFVISENGTYLEAQLRPESAELYSMDSTEMIGAHLTEVFPTSTATELQHCIDEAIQTDEIQTVEYKGETTDGSQRFEARVVPTDEHINGHRAVVWLARDITERARRERQLRARQSELETLNRINAIIHQIIETLVEAPARETIEQEVCEQLVDSDLYCGAWIVERTGNDTLTHRIEAGDAELYLDCVRELEVDHERPVERAARTGDVQITNRILEDDSLPSPLQTAARESDVRAAIAVPITYEDVTYGVLTVLAGRKDAFTPGEAAEFELLGETIGFTIMAVKNRQLLLADTVVELEFRIDGGDSFSFDLSREYDCTCSLEWAGTTANGRTFQYVTVEGLEGEAVLEAAREHDSIDECRLIHDGIQRCTIEMRLAESGVRMLTNHGATIRDITVEDSVGTCLVDVPQSADVREVADALAMIYENTELVARREVDRPVRTAAERRNRILDELTDRQLTTLRLAYYGGFFDWPRESTGEEIAEAMDVSPPTMHQHLRKGLKSILSEFFEEGGGTTE